MEKISGILPPSPRTRVAEPAAAQPARPGAPAFGRPMGRNSLGDRVTLSRELEVMRQSGELPTPEEPTVYKKPQEAKNVKIIEDLNQKFFSPKTLAREEDIAKSEETLKETSDKEGMFLVDRETPSIETPLQAIRKD
jgi:hypothetical protein